MYPCNDVILGSPSNKEAVLAKAQAQDVAVRCLAWRLGTSRTYTQNISNVISKSTLCVPSEGPEEGEDTATHVDDLLTSLQAKQLQGSAGRSAHDNLLIITGLQMIMSMQAQLQA